MKIVVCIGSSCHLKGSRNVVEELQNLIGENNLKDEINLSGAFCMGNCQKGVCVTVDGTSYSLTPSITKKFFEDNILTKF